MIGTLGIAIKSKDYYCCIGMIIATSFTYYGRREASRSPYPIKLSVVSDRENKIVEDLRDFVDLNLGALARKEDIEVVLRNATMITQNKINELDRAMNETKELVELVIKRGENRDRAMNETKELVELAIKRGEKREQELKLQLEKEGRERKKEKFIFICMFLYIIFYK